MGGLEPEEAWQPDLYHNEEINEARKQQVMQAVEKVNQRYGQRQIKIGTMVAAQKQCGSQQQEQEAWRSKAARRSPRYTTLWSELPEV